METTVPCVVEGLMNPDIYPHPCVKVELVETHISWVLLTGLRAYKIKKPLKLAFVDFSTLERRRHFCEEELRLNRRLAPELYLRVVPITGTVNAPQIDGDGPVIDYAVQMRQFNKDHVLSQLSEDQLTDSRIDRLADDCAAFDSHAQAVAPDSVYGAPHTVFASLVENFEALANADDSIVDLVADIRERAELEFGRLVHAMNERRLNGRVRECHGDLHLGNMFLENDEITIFDGIEFNPSFRWIDVASDIAFLIMDLEDRGYSRQARRFLNRWLEQTGDYDALRVLPFYCAYRATVRAKVEVIRMHQPEIGYSNQRHLVNDCQHYLRTAQSYLIRSAPSLAITMGPSGSGKSTVTQRLIERGNVIRIRSDVERKRMFGLGMLTASVGETKVRMYSESATKAVYDRLKMLAVSVIEAGFSVVVDATFLKIAQREPFVRLAESLGVPFSIIVCQASEETLRDRLCRRNAAGPDASEADATVLEAQLHEMEELSRPEKKACRVIMADEL